MIACLHHSNIIHMAEACLRAKQQAQHAESSCAQSPTIGNIHHCQHSSLEPLIKHVRLAELALELGRTC